MSLVWIFDDLRGKKDVVLARSLEVGRLMFSTKVQAPPSILLQMFKELQASAGLTMMWLLT